MFSDAGEQAVLAHPFLRKTKIWKSSRISVLPPVSKLQVITSVCRTCGVKLEIALSKATVLRPPFYSEPLSM